MSIAPDPAALTEAPDHVEFASVAAAHAWAKVPLKEKAHALKWRAHCRRLVAAKHGTMKALVRRIAEAEHCSVATVNNYLARWRAGNGEDPLCPVRNSIVKDSDNLSGTF